MATLFDLKTRALALADMQTTGGDAYLSSNELTQQINLALEDLEEIYERQGLGRDRTGFGSLSVAADVSEYNLSNTLQYTPWRVLAIYKYVSPWWHPLPILTDAAAQLPDYPMQPVEYPPVIITKKPDNCIYAIFYPHSDMTAGVVYRWRHPVLVLDTDSAALSEQEQQYVALTVAIYILTKQERDATQLYQLREALLSRWPAPVNAAGPRHTGTTLRRKRKYNFLLGDVE